MMQLILILVDANTDLDGWKSCRKRRVDGRVYGYDNDNLRLELFI
jgi:hypothetical protein